MTRHSVGLPTLLLAALAVPALASSAAAEESNRGFSLDLSGAVLRSSEEIATGGTRSYSLRGFYRFSDVWALEAALSRVDTDGQVGFLDVSAKAYLVDTSRFELYALGGPGFSRTRFGGDSVEANTLHLGIGAEIGLGGRAYLRPEIRRRWEINHLDTGAGVKEYSLGFGWKF